VLQQGIGNPLIDRWTIGQRDGTVKTRFHRGAKERTESAMKRAQIYEHLGLILPSLSLYLFDASFFSKAPRASTRVILAKASKVLLIVKIN